jgi:hypothetical protein
MTAVDLSAAAANRAMPVNGMLTIILDSLGLVSPGERGGAGRGDPLRECLADLAVEGGIFAQSLNSLIQGISIEPMMGVRTGAVL